MALKTEYQFPPKVKQRPRMTRRGRVFTPAATLAFEASVRDNWEHDITEGDIAVSIILRKDSFDVEIETYEDEDKSPLRGDIDNYVKAILDGLNGTAFTDDRYIRQLVVIKA
jgi:Holliday junction resolvase RusA-like endonuclease